MCLFFMNVVGLGVFNDFIIVIVGVIVLFVIFVGLGKGDVFLEWLDLEKFFWGILFLFGGGLMFVVVVLNMGFV